MQNAYFLRSIMLSVVRPALPHFPTLCHKWHDFRKKVWNIKLCFDFFLCFVYRTSLYNLVNKANLVHNFHLSMFISFLYMFRANM
jgi:hypothetical protein